MSNKGPVIIRQPGLLEFTESWHAMRDFTHQRHEQTADEIWLLQHPPVFTLGQAGKIEHLLGNTDIPVIATDRGGQITYHGPGQLVLYPLLDLKRLGIGVKTLVCKLEQSLINTLLELGIESKRREGAPGVYANDAKIASLGLRVRKSRSYHGMALNVDMDLTPFEWINPCGYPGMKVTQVREYNRSCALEKVENILLRQTLNELELEVLNEP